MRPAQTITTRSTFSMFVTTLSLMMLNTSLAVNALSQNPMVSMTFTLRLRPQITPVPVVISTCVVTDLALGFDSQTVLLYKRLMILDFPAPVGPTTTTLNASLSDFRIATGEPSYFRK